MEKWRELFRSGEPGDIEACMRRHDGVFRWFLIRFEPFRDETGKIAMWYGVSTDIEDLKQTEEKLREGERECLAVLGVMTCQTCLTASNALAYYEGCRTHLSLERDSPVSRAVEPPAHGYVVEIPQLGGLHHLHTRKAA